MYGEDQWGNIYGRNVDGAAYFSKGDGIGNVTCRFKG